MAGTELTKGAYAGATRDLIDNLLNEFLEDTGERLRQLEQHVERDGELEPIRRFAFEIKGQAHNFGLGTLETLARRLEDYASAVDEIDGKTEADLRAFVDAIADWLDAPTAAENDVAGLVRALPARPLAPSYDEIEVRDIEVMLVMLHGAQTSFIERELQACGYRVTIVTSTVAAMDQAVRTKPNMIIMSAVMPRLSGIDLACALANMPTTRNMPIALITSLPRGHEDLKLLPDKVPVIRKSENFGDDLAEALSYHFLL